MRALLLALCLALAAPLAAQSLMITPRTDTAFHLRATYHTSSGAAGYYAAPVQWWASGANADARVRIVPVPGVSYVRDIYLVPLDTGGVWVHAGISRKTQPTWIADSVYIQVRRTLSVALATPPALDTITRIVIADTSGRIVDQAHPLTIEVGHTTQLCAMAYDAANVLLWNSCLVPVSPTGGPAFQQLLNYRLALASGRTITLPRWRQ